MKKTFENKVPILGIKIDSITYKQLLKKIQSFFYSKKQHYIVTVNPEFVMTAQKDNFFRYILNNADIATADGTGIKIASWFLGMKIKKRITGVDLTYKIAKICLKNKKSIFLLGGNNNAATKTAEKLKKLYPNLKICGYLQNIQINNPKHIPDFVSERIKSAKPDVLLVALGAPKQEKFIYYQLKNFPTVKLAIGVGGTFDFISGNIKRAPKIIRKIGFEWIYRFFQEPKRFKRIFINAFVKFAFTVVYWRLRIICCFRKNVVGVIKNKQRQYLLVQRANEPQEHWQFPQGGVEAGESEEKAVLREMQEELGNDRFKIIKRLEVEHRYVWSKWHQLIKGYKGQKQHFYLLKYFAQDKDFKFYISKEILDFKWVNKNEILKNIHQVRKHSAKKIIEQL